MIINKNGTLEYLPDFTYDYKLNTTGNTVIYKVPLPDKMINDINLLSKDMGLSPGEFIRLSILDAFQKHTNLIEDYINIRLNDISCILKSYNKIELHGRVLTYSSFKIVNSGDKNIYVINFYKKDKHYFDLDFNIIKTDIKEFKELMR